MPRPKITRSVRAAVKQLGGDDGWWHASGQEEFETIAEDLAAHGIDNRTIIGLLSRAHAAVANEYGG